MEGGREGERNGCSGVEAGGRMQVNKALLTCTSWYAYAAMFGSSTDDTLCPPRAPVYVQPGVEGGKDIGGLEGGS